MVKIRVANAFHSRKSYTFNRALLSRVKKEENVSRQTCFTGVWKCSY